MEHKSAATYKERIRNERTIRTKSRNHQAKKKIKHAPFEYINGGTGVWASRILKRFLLKNEKRTLKRERTFFSSGV